MKEEIIRRITLNKGDIKSIIAQKYDVQTYHITINDDYDDLEAVIETPLKILQHKDKEDIDRLIREHKASIVGVGFHTEE